VKRSVKFVVAALLVVAAGAVSGVARAHTISVPKYAYYVEYVGGSTLYRCAAGSSSIGHAGSYIAIDSQTWSHYQAFCAGNYAVAASNVRANTLLIYFDQGNAVLCFESSVWMNTSTSYFVDTTEHQIGVSRCGSGAYQNWSFHKVYINGTPRDGALATASHSY